MLTREELLKKIAGGDREVGAFGGTVSIRDITLLELGEIMAEISKLPESRKSPEKIARVVALGMVEPKATADEILGLKASCEDDVWKLYVEIIGSAEQAEKNSGTTPTVNSSSL